MFLLYLQYYKDLGTKFNFCFQVRFSLLIYSDLCMEEFGNIQKNKALSVRLEPNYMMRLGEVANVMGVPVSTVVKAGISNILNEMYTDEGYLKDMTFPKGNRVHAGSGYFRAADVAKSYGISSRLISDWIKAGKVSYLKYNNKVYVLLKDVEKNLYGKNKHNKKR